MEEFGQESGEPRGWRQDSFERELWSHPLEWSNALTSLPTLPSREVTATWAGQLARTIETEVIPRLMLVHRLKRSMSAGHTVPRRHSPDAAQIEQFARACLSDDAGAASRFVDEVLASGVSLESVYLDLITGTARKLGEDWCNDTRDFAQVTVGLWRMQQLMSDRSASFQQQAQSARTGRRALLCAAPGSQHTLGVLMVAEFFRKSGWAVNCEVSATRDELLASSRSAWFDVVGVSIGREQDIEPTAKLIAALRAASCNPLLCVLAGGAIFENHPEYVAMLGADAATQDATHAVDQAERLVAMRQCEQLAQGAVLS